MTYKTKTTTPLANFWNFRTLALTTDIHSMARGRQIYTQYTDLIIYSRQNLEAI